MSPTLPVDSVDINEAKVGLVYEGGGLDVSFGDIASVVRDLVPGAEIEFERSKANRV